MHILENNDMKTGIVASSRIAYQSNIIEYTVISSNYIYNINSEEKLGIYDKILFKLMEDQTVCDVKRVGIADTLEYNDVIEVFELIFVKKLFLHKVLFVLFNISQRFWLFDL